MKMNRTIIIGMSIAVFLTGCGRSRHHQGIYDRTGVTIKAGQMAKVSHSNCVALVDFTSFRTNGATYRWRCACGDNHLESSGTGEVRDTSIQLLPFLIYQSGSDTNFWVRAGKLWLPWSYGSTNSACLYYTKGKTELVLLPNATFETEELSIHHSGRTP